METIFEKSQEGHFAFSLPKDEAAWAHFEPPQELLRTSPLFFPELSELDLTRHFIALSSRNVGIDNVFIPLGSCTMKFNPRINESCASLPGFASTHPFAPNETVQGNLKLIDALLSFFMKLTGMTGGTLVPNAGAQGELTGVKMIAAYHRKKGDVKRKEFLVPDSAHGTNPATVSMAGFEVRSIGTDSQGHIDIGQLKNALSDKTAGMLLTNPSTLGLFSTNILEITQMVHDAGGLVYYDGANLNPILTVVKPLEMGFDVMHLNLHKTFSTPHGGGGPGSGPVLCNDTLAPFLPLPRVQCKDGACKSIWNNETSIGFMAPFFGNFGIYLRAYAYILFHGFFGLRRIAENAVLNANYLKTLLKPLFDQPFPQHCMHEFVVQTSKFSGKGVKAFDIAKRLLDYGVHAPTVYFPLIVKECFLIEPAETESKRTLDRFASIMEKICEEVENNPETVRTAPHNLTIGRLNETLAAKYPVLIDPLIARFRENQR
jgi:glycine dehydrogenase subunit 2